MKRNLKRMFALMLALALSLTMLQGVAFANPVTIDGVEYTINAGTNTAYVSDCDNNSLPTGGAISIPAKVTISGTECTVTSIGDNAFNICRNLTSVTLPDTVTLIGEAAFLSCSSLTEVTFIGDSKLETIGEQAFGHTALTSITIPKSVTSIEFIAFSGCDELTSVTFNGTPMTIGDSIFGRNGPAAKIDTINFAGDFDETMITRIANALTAAASGGNGGVTPLDLSNLTLNYNQSWSEDDVKKLIAEMEKIIGNAPNNKINTDNIKFYNPTPTPPPVTTTTPSGTIGGSSTGGTGGGGAGAWYIGTLNTGGSGGAGGSTFVPTYTQISDEQSTTQMLQSGNTITVIGGSPSGVIVKLDPTALAGKQSLSIQNSIANLQLTAEQIASLIQQAGDNTIHITIKQTADGSTISILAGGRTINL